MVLFHDHEKYNTALVTQVGFPEQQPLSRVRRGTFRCGSVQFSPVPAFVIRTTRFCQQSGSLLTLRTVFFKGSTLHLVIWGYRKGLET
jgi:hypothetical protein